MKPLHPLASKIRQFWDCPLRTDTPPRRPWWSFLASHHHTQRLNHRFLARTRHPNGSSLKEPVSLRSLQPNNSYCSSSRCSESRIQMSLSLLVQRVSLRCFPTCFLLSFTDKRLLLAPSWTMLTTATADIKLAELVVKQEARWRSWCCRKSCGVVATIDDWLGWSHYSKDAWLMLHVVR